MPHDDTPPRTIDIAPLTQGRWDDFATLCRRMGGNRGCWCFWWRESKNEPRIRPRRVEAQALLAEDRFPGLLAYVGDEPVGWCALDRRSSFPRLNTTRDTASAPQGATGRTPADDDPWVLPCFFVLEEWRHRGVTRALLAASLDEISRRGGRVVEAVPVDPATTRRSPSGSYTGTLPLFLAAGFEEVARPTPTGRVLVRRTLSSGPNPGH
ncbi:GNAT family N-acetyltransferase [Streptomyces sp. NPDC020681]|uniref:GNAT family N-acetyltransferase n=1 Tax=Streptomyces sp. NPDC020681 TaxID=3365083 RepID=UPI0037898EBB